MRGLPFALAVLVAVAIGTQARAGMSGTSERIQQQNAQPSAPPGPAPAPRESFDGVWTVASSPGCGLLARSAVKVSRGRIAGPTVSGRVDADGNVRTVSSGFGLSVISKGRVSGTSGSGTYQVSNGCAGTWTARKA